MSGSSEPENNYLLSLSPDFNQVKVMTDCDLLAIACEQFLGKSVMEIKAVVLQTLEGHLRSILGETFATHIYSIIFSELWCYALGFKKIFCCLFFSFNPSQVL